MHVDFPQEKTPYALLEEIVVVAGDTGNGLTGLKFLDKMRRKGHTVLAIDGNHEHYGNVTQGRHPNETTERFRESNPNTLELGDYQFIGVNGWYAVSDGWKWYGYMSDGPNILGNGNADVAAVKMNKMAYDDYVFLQESLKASPKKCVVVTHTAPCLDTLDPKFEGHYSNEWYHNPLMPRLIEAYKDKIAVWCHGHTHTSSDKVVNDVRVVCNPRGYPKENPKWTPLTIEV